MKKIITKSGIILGLMVPLVTFAQQKNLKYLIDIVIEYLQYGIYLILSLAIVMFVWNVYKYFIAGGDDIGAKKEAGLYVMWSVIGFFVILSFWGLVNILTNTIKLDSDAPSSGFFGSFFSSSSSGSNSTGVFGKPIQRTNNDGSIQRTSQ